MKHFLLMLLTSALQWALTIVIIATRKQFVTSDSKTNKNTQVCELRAPFDICESILNHKCEETIETNETQTVIIVSEPVSIVKLVNTRKIQTNKICVHDYVSLKTVVFLQAAILPVYPLTWAMKALTVSYKADDCRKNLLNAHWGFATLIPKLWLIVVDSFHKKFVHERAP